MNLAGPTITEGIRRQPLLEKNVDLCFPVLWAWLFMEKNACRGFAYCIVKFSLTQNSLLRGVKKKKYSYVLERMNTSRLLTCTSLEDAVYTNGSNLMKIATYVRT